MKYKILIKCFILLTASFNIAYSQTSVVQDTKGETSLNLGSTGVVAFNAKDESVSFSYGAPLGRKTRGLIDKYHYIGIKAKAKGKNSFLTLVKNDDFTFDGSAGFFWFKDISYGRDPGRTDRIDNIYASIDYLSSRLKLLDISAPFSNQVYDKTISGYRVTLGANHINSYNGSKVKFNYIVGAAIAGGAKNNSEDLKTVSVSTVTTIIDPATNATRVIQKDIATAYNIVDFKGSQNYLNINVDFGPQIGKRFLFLVHPRYSILEGRKPQFNPAIGIYVNKAGAPLEVITGLQLQVLDYTNSSESNKTRGERTVLNIVAGYVF